MGGPTPHQNGLPGRPAQQPPQQRSQSQHSGAGSSSSQVSSVQKTGARPTDAKLPSEIFGKTSGWHHGSKFNIEEFIKSAEIRNKSTFKGCLKAGLNVNYCRWTKGDKFVGDGARSIADIVASRNDVEAMRLLIEYKVDLSGTASATFASNSSTRSRFDFLFPGDEKRTVEKDLWTTPLHIACRYGYVEMVRTILEEGWLDPNTPDSQLRVGLHMNATGSGSLDVARILLKMGATVDLQARSAAKPLATAAAHGRTELVKLLIEHGAYIDSADSCNETAIFKAALQDHFTTISALVSRGGFVDLPNSLGESPFFKAASNFRSKCMEILMDCGADIDTRDKNGCTPLLRATMAKNTPLMICLLQMGADIDSKDNEGWTPLFVAMVLKDESLIQLLIQLGANLGETDNYNNTALSQAAIIGGTSVVRYILSSPHHKTSDYQQMNLAGETALALACKHNNAPIVKLLLKHGDDPTYVDPNGYRALDRALYWGNFACARPLFEANMIIESKSLLALDQGRFDHPQISEGYDMIQNHLNSLHPQMVLRPSKASSPLRDLFARPITRDGLLKRMCQKQGKPSLDTAPLQDGKDEGGVISADPFEACIPLSPIAQIINNHTTNINAKRIGALEVGAAGASVALGVTSAILGL